MTEGFLVSRPECLRPLLSRPGRSPIFLSSRPERSGVERSKKIDIFKVMKSIGGHNYFVYILTNKNKTVLYIGVTNNLKVRIFNHRNPGLVTKIPFATKYKCFYLVYYERYQYIDHAIDRETQLKKWRREKKNKLISDFNPNWDFLNDIVND
jgi:putative endonuclease